MSTSPTLSADQIEEQLDRYLDSILSSRRTAAEPARRLASLKSTQQQKAFDWIEIISSTNAELAFQFANYVPQAMRSMDDEGVKAWVLKAMDVFDISGLHVAIAHLTDVDNFSRERKALMTGLSFENIGGVLNNFIHGLSGRNLKVQSGDKTYTDTQKAHTIFHALETIRLDACLSRDLPGIHRVMVNIRQKLNGVLIPPAWSKPSQSLLDINANVETSLKLVALLVEGAVPSGLCYQGILQCDAVANVKAARLKWEKTALRKAIGKLQSELQTESGDQEIPSNDLDDKPHQFKLDIQQDEEQPLNSVSTSVWTVKLSVCPPMCIIIYLYYTGFI